jgi:hypothetical protein
MFEDIVLEIEYAGLYGIKNQVMYHFSINIGLSIMTPPYNDRDDLAKVHVDYAHVDCSMPKYNVWLHNRNDEIKHLAAYDSQLAAMAHVSGFNKK